MGVLATTIRQKTKLQVIQIGREGKTVTFVYDIWDFILCKCPSSKKSPKKLLEVLSEFSKIADYKINIQKTAPYMYTSNEIAER